jgi:hypothetical protein
MSVGIVFPPLLMRELDHDWNIVGNTMTVVSGSITGSIALGQAIFDGNNRILNGTYITAGAVLVWTLNQPNAAGATFTGTGSGTNLTASAVTGPIVVGDIVSGTDGVHSLPAGASILAQLTGPAGSAGTYQISTGATLNACTVTAASTVLNATAVAAGLLQVGQTLADGSAAVAPGTMITGQLSGPQGGAGLYSISKQQTVASEAMTTTLKLTPSNV